MSYPIADEVLPLTSPPMKIMVFVRYTANRLVHGKGTISLPNDMGTHMRK